MRHFLLPLLALALLPLPAGAAGIVISPVQLGLVGAPGTTVSGVINVSSPRPQENRIEVSFGDYAVDAAGKRDEVTNAQPGARSCRNWLDVEQNQFVSPERGTVPVVITAHIPANASGSYWAAVYFAVVPTPPSFDPSVKKPVIGLQMLPRIGVPVIVTVKGTEKFEIKVAKISAKRTDAGLDVSVVVRNTGNAAVMISGALALERGSSNVPEELASKDIDAVTSYPGSDRVIRTTLPPVAANDGSVDLHAYLRYGRAAGQSVEASSRLAAILEGDRRAAR